MPIQGQINLHKMGHEAFSVVCEFQSSFHHGPDCYTMSSHELTIDKRKGCSRIEHYLTRNLLALKCVPRGTSPRN